MHYYGKIIQNHHTFVRFDSRQYMGKLMTLDFGSFFQKALQIWESPNKMAQINKYNNCDGQNFQPNTQRLVCKDFFPKTRKSFGGKSSHISCLFFISKVVIKPFFVGNPFEDGKLLNLADSNTIHPKKSGKNNPKCLG